MNFTIVDHPQRSPEWFTARAGRLTGSRASDMLAKIKTGEAAARRDYRLQLAAERLTGQPQESDFVNAAMQHGIDTEPVAFAAYESATGEMVRRTGFLCADDHMVGCSLDGDVADFAGIIELKAPKTATHISYLKADCIPANHLPQLRHNLWVTGAEYVDFVSFDDRLPRGLQLFIKRLLAKDAQLPAYETEALAFLSEVDDEIKTISGIRAIAA